MTLAETSPRYVDIGLVNRETYFINVCAGGLLTNVSQTVDKDVKNALGNLSYYLKGMEQIPNFHKIPFSITTSDEVLEEDLYLYMIMNSAGTGSASQSCHRRRPSQTGNLSSSVCGQNPYWKSLLYS